MMVRKGENVWRKEEGTERRKEVVKRIRKEGWKQEYKMQTTRAGRQAVRKERKNEMDTKRKDGNSRIDDRKGWWTNGRLGEKMRGGGNRKTNELRIQEAALVSESPERGNIQEENEH